jgi:catechol 2,3-dioxygenase-like lactoylglutathione lyase family enzyme
MEATAETTIERVIPVLASLDFDRTIKFYEGRLGFKTLFRTEGRLGMSRKGMEIHFWECTDPHIAANTSCSR